MSRSPLRYPGGKSRAAKFIAAKIPDHVTELMSPFFGGGSVELECAARGINVYGYDKFKPLVAFWRLLLKQPDYLADEVQKFSSLTKQDFYKLQKKHIDDESNEQGIFFFVLNRASFSGITLSGGCSEESVNHRFTLSSIDRLRNFHSQNKHAQRLQVEYSDFHDSLDKHPDIFMYLDPPYMINSHLYGNQGSAHKGFDHDGLHAKLIKRKNWILSYNNCERVTELYAGKGFEIIYPDWKYGMSKDKESKEVLILNL